MLLLRTPVGRAPPMAARIVGWSVFVAAILFALAVAGLALASGSPTVWCAATVPLSVSLLLAWQQFQVMRRGRSPTEVNVVLYGCSFLLFACTVFLMIFSFAAPSAGKIVGTLVMAFCSGVAFFATECNLDWCEYYRAERARGVLTDSRCLNCRYDLRATPDPSGPLLERCPECGLPAGSTLDHAPAQPMH